jgi:hypothetical protein
VRSYFAKSSTGAVAGGRELAELRLKLTTRDPLSGEEEFRSGIRQFSIPAAIIRLPAKSRPQ